MRTAFVICLLITSAVRIGIAQKQPAAADDSTLRGCLRGDGEGLYLSSDDGNIYKLTGRTTGLAKASEKEVLLLGKIKSSTDRYASFAVSSLQQIFIRPLPRLNSKFNNGSAWQVKTNHTYGIRMSHPGMMQDLTDSNAGRQRPSFAVQESSVMIAGFDIPRDLFEHTNFVGGSFSTFVNPTIKNLQTCSVFEDAHNKSQSLHYSGGIQYVSQKSVGVGMGTAYISQDYHTFQNGRCYELAFDLAEYNTGNEDLGCKVPVLRDSDEAELINPLIAGISFIPPSVTRASADVRPVPARIIELKPSSRIADSVLNHGRVQISWSSEGAEYIQLSYTCSPLPEKPGVMINDDSSRDCENSKAHIEYSPPAKLPPSGARDISIESYKRDTPIDVIVTATPFSGGVAYPSASKTTTIKVNPTKLSQSK